MERGIRTFERNKQTEFFFCSRKETLLDSKCCFSEEEVCESGERLINYWLEMGMETMVIIDQGSFCEANNAVTKD